MSSYEQIHSQPKRLGNLSLEGFGELGQSEAEGIITALGNAVTGTVAAITRAKVLTQQSKDRRAVAITEAIENTKKLEISTKGAVEQAAIGVESVKATYGSITKLVIGSGVVFSGLLITAAFAYKLASGDQGDYEIVYE